MEGESGKVVFKPYDQSQQYLLPPSLEELVPSGHMVRVVNEVVDGMDLAPLLNGYKGGGTSSYHPKMLLKVLIYAYSQRIYSSRQVAKALRENVHFMWLSGGNRPDFRTINRFRSSRLQGVIEEVFCSVVELLVEAGLIELKDYFLDGTKIEANANRYSFVWGKSTRRYQSRLQQQVKALLVEIERENERENARYGERDLEELGEHSDPIDSERLAEKLEELQQRLGDQQVSEDREDLSTDESKKRLQKAVKKISKDYLPRQRKYEQQQRKLGERNSYSKTDEDATFMRMKEDHMRNGQLKPGYNIQMGTENQFIVGYSIHQQTTDTSLLVPHLEGLKRRLGRLPENLIADAGYGSHENYSYLDSKKVTSYVKYGSFHQQQKRKFKQDRFKTENLPYDQKTDSFICPAGRRLIYVESERVRSRNGYKSTCRIYQAENCRGCQLRAQCHSSKFNRRIRINRELNHLRSKARELLLSEQGKRYRSRRPVEVESVFAQIKHNKSFRRFMLRGLNKVNIEYGLVAIAHNLAKWRAYNQILPQIA